MNVGNIVSFACSLERHSSPTVFKIHICTLNSKSVNPFLSFEAVHTLAEQGYIKVGGVTQLISYYGFPQFGVFVPLKVSKMAWSLAQV